MEFCEKLGIKDLNLMFCQSGADYATPYYLQEEQSSMVGENAKNNEEIDIEDVEDGEEVSLILIYDKYLTTRGGFNFF